MKPGIVGGAGVGALILCAAYQFTELVGGNLFAIPGLIWDVFFMAIGLYQVFGPTPSVSSHKGAGHE